MRNVVNESKLLDNRLSQVWLQDTGIHTCRLRFYEAHLFAHPCATILVESMSCCCYFRPSETITNGFIQMFDEICREKMKWRRRRFLSCCLWTLSPWENFQKVRRRESLWCTSVAFANADECSLLTLMPMKCWYSSSPSARQPLGCSQSSSLTQHPFSIFGLWGRGAANDDSLQYSVQSSVNMSSTSLCTCSSLISWRGSLQQGRRRASSMLRVWTQSCSGGSLMH